MTENTAAGSFRLLGARAPLSSFRVRLRPVLPGHTPRIYDMAFSPSNSHSWRYYGGSVSLAEFERLLWDRVLSQFVLTRASNGSTVGLVQCVGANFRHGTAQINVLLAEEVQKSAWPFEGVALFLNYVFTSFPLRKVYAEVPEFNFPQISSGVGRYFTIEGRLTSHEWHLGRYWDQLILAMTAESILSPEVGRWIAYLASEPENEA